MSRSYDAGEEDQSKALKMKADDALEKTQPCDAGNERSQSEALRLQAGDASEKALLSDAGDADEEEQCEALTTRPEML